MLSTNTGSRFPPPNPAKDPRRAFFFIFREVLSNILALHLVIEGSSHFGKQTDCGASAFGCQVRRDVRMQIFSGAVSRVHLHALLSWQHGERKSGIIVERSYIFNNTSGKWQCRTWHMCATVKMVKPGGGGPLISHVAEVSSVRLQKLRHECGGLLPRTAGTDLPSWIA